MKEYLRKMVCQAKDNFQFDLKEEDLVKLEKRLFNSNLTDEQIKYRIDLAYSMIKKNYEKIKADELVKKGIISGNNNQVRQTAKTIFSDKFLSDKLSIYGGALPYLLTSSEAKRIIGDINTHADLDKMQMIRDYIYSHPDEMVVLYDSLELSGEDYGMVLTINELKVSVFPTIQMPDGMVIRTFFVSEILGEIEIIETLFPGIVKKDEIRTCNVDGVLMRFLSPEFTFLTKQVANRSKDIEDNKILETIVNYESIERIRKQMKTPIVISDKTVCIKINE